VRYISAADPPLLILHGGQDALVPFNQGELLYEALRAACRDSAFYFLPAGTHGAFEKFLSDDAVRAGTAARATNAKCKHTSPKAVTPSWETVVAFFKRTLK
jgi:fermentation-respiration switch protein FrsA (DUF1100 family)